ncbi:3-dehydroquinate synthase [Geobacter sp. OR-1]|uniref:3-dehydroquinate synthase n=1 Tax=Geobacter sp. OR-1 TaxID=1266765 RepID=UPI0005A9F40A|nr:3-dehydroquinate synthase [Geobacter sp. OR-1]
MDDLSSVGGNSPDVTVSLGDRSYGIAIGSGTLGNLGQECLKLEIGKKVAIITNPTVAGYYLASVRTSLESAGFNVAVVEIPDGEEFKNLDTVASVYNDLVDAGMNRGGFVVALGGGVVGDLAGFAAATFLRGIEFVQVPTTLLSQVDSSVGGKTGVNLDKGKNLVGAFHQPRFVLIDVMTLSTLPEREFIGGLAEVIKYGAVLDAELFGFLEQHSEEILARDPEPLKQIISWCCRLKADVVAQDERETGLRAVLNFGHTLGHAVELLTGYGKYSHGEAVAIGMVAAASFSEQKGFAAPEDTARIRALLARMGLPAEAPQFAPGEYIASLVRDKKSRDGGITFVCNKGIGGFSFERVTDLWPLLSASGIGG